jgi:hypothetical protein
MGIIENKVQVNSKMNNAHRSNESMVEQTLVHPLKVHERSRNSSQKELNIFLKQQ